jgi:hypothetical protein
MRGILQEPVGGYHPRVIATLHFICGKAGAGNTVRSRQWVRTVFEAAEADHVLHVIDATDAECLANIHRRNGEKPAGVYWGDVGDDTFHAVTAYFVPPVPAEGFRVQTHVQPRVSARATEGERP